MWTTGTIDDLCTIEYGTRVVKKNERGTEYPVYGGGGESFRIDKFNRSDRLIIARFGMSLKCTRYVSGKFFLNDSGLTLSPKNENLSQPYLDKLILNLNNKIFCLGSGSAQKNLRMDKFKLLKISYPSLLEQQRVVAKINTAFAEIDKNITNIQNIKSEIKILRANIIKERFKESYANIQKYFSEVCTLKRGYDLPKIKRKAGKFPLLSANGVTDYIDNFKIKGPGVVTGRSGTIGKVHFIEKDFHPLNTALYVKDFKGNVEKYIYYLLTSFNLDRFSSGAGVPTLNRNVLSNEIVFINLDRNTQAKISKILDSLELEIEKMLSIIIKKEELYQLLKSKILSKELQADIL